MQPRGRGSKAKTADKEHKALAKHRRNAKESVTVSHVMRKPYDSVPHTKQGFTPRRKGIITKPMKEKGSFRDLAGSASRHWTVSEMLKRLEELRKGAV